MGATTTANLASYTCHQTVKMTLAPADESDGFVKVTPHRLDGTT